MSEALHMNITGTHGFVCLQGEYCLCAPCCPPLPLNEETEMWKCGLTCHGHLVRGWGSPEVNWGLSDALTTWLCECPFSRCPPCLCYDLLSGGQGMEEDSTDLNQLLLLTEYTK